MAGNVGLQRENGGDRRFTMPLGEDAAIGGDIGVWREIGGKLRREREL